MKAIVNSKPNRLWAAIAAVSTSYLVFPTLASAQEINIPSPIEEVLILGRQRSTTKDIVTERIEYDVVTDIIGIDQISRVGDSTVAAALRRVPGLTLIDGKFVYVRGLGERYSSTQLNGAMVPSPDLQRNVIPLDIFPTDILESIKVQKVFSPDMPAGFGGGNIDIRTKSIPEEFSWKIGFGSGINSESDDGLGYAGGDDDWQGKDDGTRAFPNELSAAINTYRGDIGVTNIQQVLFESGDYASLAAAEADAVAINRELLSSLNRNININERSREPDQNVKGSIGSKWAINDAWDIGAMGIGSYKRSWRTKNRINRLAGSEDSNRSETQRSIDQVDITAGLNVGLEYYDEQSIELSTLFIRNTEDEASLTTGIKDDTAADEQFLNYDIRYEQRELLVNQAKGEHYLYRLIDNEIINLPFDFLDEMTVTWYYSDSRATTDIPNEVSIQADNTIDLATGAVIQTEIEDSATAASFGFIELVDELESYGWDVNLPLESDSYLLKLSAGYDYSRKARQYLGKTVNISTANTDLADRIGEPEDVFGGNAINDSSNNISGNFESSDPESYLAAQINDAAYGKFDVTFYDKYRISGGVRWEDFKQLAVPINILDFNDRLGIPRSNIDEDIIFQEDAIYPAVSFSYLSDDFWAEEFQLRIGYGRTTVRPDLREISETRYIDPLTEFRVVGNPNLIASELDNFDLRGEWFFGNGDNFTLSLFYKDISDAIETTRRPGSDNNIVLTFENSVSGEIYGAEIEWFKGLEFMGDWATGFFTSGNLTVSDSEIDFGELDRGLTNNQRRMTGHSEYVLNIQLGFDSEDNKHSATLAYNIFGERIFFGARDGADDAFEQPFGSLNLVYSYFPTETITAKLKITNLLDDQKEIEQGNTIIFEEKIGQTYSLDLSWSY